MFCIIVYDAYNYKHAARDLFAIAAYTQFYLVNFIDEILQNEYYIFIMSVFIVID